MLGILLSATSAGFAGDVPAPRDFRCIASYDAVSLTWSSPADYESFRVTKVIPGLPPVDLAVEGEKTSLSDPFVSTGVASLYPDRYEIRGVLAGEESEPASCDTPAWVPFVRGDINRDGTVSISDAATIDNWLFKYAALPACHEAADANDDDVIRLNDVFFLMEGVFGNGPVFPEPFPFAQVDTRPSSFACTAPAGERPAIDESFLIRVGSVSGNRGEVIRVPVFGESPVETDAFSLSLAFDPTQLVIEGADIYSGTIIDWRGMVHEERVDAEAGYYRLGLMVNFKSDVHIPPLNGEPIANLKVRILETAADGETEIRPVDDVGNPPAVNEYSVLGEAVYAATYPRLVAARIGIGVPGNIDFFARTDVDGDGRASISDAIRILDFLFLAGVPIDCLDAADADDDGSLNITDAVVILGHLFLGRGGIPEPWGKCGADPTADDLSCARETCE